MADECAEKLAGKIIETLQSGQAGDGKIFVYNIEDAYRIRTGEHGAEAL